MYVSHKNFCLINFGARKFHILSHQLSTFSSSSSFLSSRAGLPVSNDETDSNKSGSSHSDPHTYHTSLLYPHPHQVKGKQLPKGMHLNTMELLDLTNDEDSANARRLDRLGAGELGLGDTSSLHVELGCFPECCMLYVNVALHVDMLHALYF